MAKKKEAQVEVEAESAESLDEIVGKLKSSSRRERQEAATRIAEMAKGNPDELVPFTKNIIEALSVPEAHTRWECYDALSCLVSKKPRMCTGALEVAEESLFDEENGTVRLASLRFVCKVGATGPKTAAEVWPLLDEVLQCYHGDPEYIDMLVAINEFAQAKLPNEVREGLIERMEFDANNAKSGMQRRANAIIAAAKGESI